MLKDVRVKPKNFTDIRRLIIFLHGYGSDCHDLIALESELDIVGSSNFYVSVNAPYMCEHPNSNGYQWFSLKDLDPVRIRQELKEVSIILERYIIDLIKELDINHNNIFLVGFSQGAMLSLYSGLKMKGDIIKGIVALSGRLFHKNGIIELNSTPSIMLNHGRYDTIVPYHYMKESEGILKKNNLNVKSYTSDCGHNIDRECLERIKNFITDQNQ